MGGAVKNDRSKRSRWWRVAVVVPVLAMVVTGTELPAFGHHGYPVRYDTMFPSANYRNNSSACLKGSVWASYACRADNGTHTVHFRTTVPSNLVTGTRASLDGSYHPGTHLSIIYHSSSNVSYSGGAETDVIYGGTSQNLSNQTYGAAYCDDPVESWWGGSTPRCDQFYVIYNRNLASSLSSSGTRFLGCHETGHTVGLLHGRWGTPQLANNDSSLACMVTGTNPNTSNRYLKEHNTYEINRTY